MSFYDESHLVKLDENGSFVKASDSFADHYGMMNKIKDYGRRGHFHNPIIINKVDPKIREMDKDYEDMVTSIWYDLENKLPAESGKFTLTDTLISHDWSGLSTIMGWYWNPIGDAPVNNKELTRSKKPTEHELNSFKKITKRFFSGYASCHSRIKRDSSAGIIFHSNDLGLKESCIYNFFDNVDEIKELSLKHDMKGLLRKGITNVFLLGERGQTDSAASFEFKDEFTVNITSKERYVNHGDKKITPNRKVPGYDDSRQARRTRRVFGGSSSINLPFGMLIAPFREYALNHDPTLSRVFHHTTTSEWSKKIEGYEHIVGWDFSQFDMTIPFEIVNTFFEVFDSVLPDKYAFSRELFPHAPVVFGNPRLVKMSELKKLKCELLATRDPLSYDPSDPDFSSGNQSGQFAVSTLAKVAAVWQVGLVLEKIGIIEDAGNVLDEKNLERVMIMNSGDDTLLAFKDEDKNYAKAVEDLINNKDDSLFFDISLEKPITFLGHVLAMVDGERKFLPDLTSYIIKLLRPEHHLDDKPYPELGYWLRKDYYNAHPKFEIVDEILQRRSEQAYGMSFDEIFKLPTHLEEYLDEIQKLEADKKMVNLIFMDNPDSIYYKIDPEDVDPEELDKFFLTFPPSDIDTLFGVEDGYIGKLEDVDFDPNLPDHFSFRR